MLTKKITFEDYNGATKTRSYMFNLTKSEITELQLSTSGGLSEMIQSIIDSENQQEIIAIFKKIILMAYGEKSLDGERFDKSEEMSSAFSHTPAYDKLFMELATNSVAGAEFIKGIVPKDLADKMDEVNTDTTVSNSPAVAENTGSVIPIS